jgi:hypothetical protein
LFDVIVQYWWRVATLVGVVGGMWCFAEAWRLDGRWEELTAEWDRRHHVLAEKCHADAAEIRRTKNAKDALEVAVRNIDSRRELSDAQTQAVVELQELYAQKTYYWYLEALFFMMTGLFPIIGTWQRRWLARRAKRRWNAMADGRDEDESDDRGP